ncbi:MAG TPA: hypothetical protein PK678_09510, partial [Ferruginibacter sp.]|nr:hypothetical protein [Ferruginibacter sp.]
MFKQILSFLLMLGAITGASAQVSQVQENPAGISARLQFEIDKTKDPALGYVPQSRLVEAYRIRSERIKNNTASSLFSWTERGPNSDAVGASNGNTRPGNG